MSLSDKNSRRSAIPRCGEEGLETLENRPCVIKKPRYRGVKDSPVDIIGFKIVKNKKMPD